MMVASTIVVQSNTSTSASHRSRCGRREMRHTDRTVDAGRMSRRMGVRLRFDAGTGHRSGLAVHVVAARTRIAQMMMVMMMVMGTTVIRTTSITAAATALVLLGGVELGAVHRLHVFAQRTRIGVALRAARCLADVRFLGGGEMYYYFCLRLFFGTRSIPHCCACGSGAWPDRWRC